MPDILVDFFNKYELYDNKIFGYIGDNSTIIDIKNDPNLVFIGCYPKVIDGILVGFRVILPRIIDDRTLFIWLHEYLHAIMLYDKIGERYNIDDHKLEEEIVPVCYEKLFVLDNPQYNDYYQIRDNYLRNTKIPNYEVAFQKREDLVKKLKK